MRLAFNRLCFGLNWLIASVCLLKQRGLRLKNKVLEKSDIPCPMCGKSLVALSRNRVILRCNHCSMTLALGEIIGQHKTMFCIFANKCEIYNPFTKKCRTRIFCRKYKGMKPIEFCKLSCEYRNGPAKHM